MSRSLSATDLQSLMTYDPLTGGLFWKDRTPELYAKFCGTSIEAAEKSCKWFNQRYAGQHVGITKNGSQEYVRISIGGDANNNTRRNILDLIWIVASGEEPTGVVKLVDELLPKRPDNLVCFSNHVAQIFKNRRTGVYRNAAEKTYYWRISDGEKLTQKGGYATAAEAGAARDQALKELGLWSEVLLSDLLQG